MTRPSPPPEPLAGAAVEREVVSPGPRKPVLRVRQAATHQSARLKLSLVGPVPRPVGHLDKKIVRSLQPVTRPAPAVLAPPTVETNEKAELKAADTTNQTKASDPSSLPPAAARGIQPTEQAERDKQMSGLPPAADPNSGQRDAVTSERQADPPKADEAATKVETDKSAASGSDAVGSSRPQNDGPVTLSEPRQADPPKADEAATKVETDKSAASGSDAVIASRPQNDGPVALSEPRQADTPKADEAATKVETDKSAASGSDAVVASRPQNDGPVALSEPRQVDTPKADEVATKVETDSSGNDANIASRSQNDGPAAVSELAQMSPEILNSLLESGRRLTGLDFPIAVGEHVPDDVNLAVVPIQIATQVPELGGRLFFIVGDKVVVADPQTRQIMQIIAPHG